MIFYTDGIMVIRTMTEKDVPIIVSEETAQGWNADAKKYIIKRLSDMESGKSVAITAEYYGNVAGYVNVCFSGNEAIRGQHLLHSI